MTRKTILFVAALMTSTSLVHAQQPPQQAQPSAKEMQPAEKSDAPSKDDKAPLQKKGPSDVTKEKPQAQMKDEKGPSKEQPSGKAKPSTETTVEKGEGAKGATDRKPDAAEMKSDDKKATAGAGSSGDGKTALKAVTPEQRTKVRTTFSSHRVEPAKNLNISINVGVRVPREVRFYSIPADIIVFVPEYRRYRYFMVGDVVYIVDPDTYEVVDIIT